nr:hypothetical protein [Desulfobacterales bacterium]
MARDEDDSWKTIIKSKGIRVVSVISGLGENPEIAKIFIKHARDVAQDNQIGLQIMTKRIGFGPMQKRGLNLFCFWPYFLSL